VRPKIDPRGGDIEDDASSSKRRSLLSLAGSLLAEISLPKLAVAWMLLIVFPGLMLGIAPIVASIWFNKLSDRFASSLAGVWSAILLVALVALGWFGGRRVFRLAERSFWSLNSLAVQPLYTACRETLRHLVGHRLSPDATRIQRSRLHATTAVMSGVVICGIALLALMLAWPSSHLLGDIAILSSPKRLAMVTLANSVVLVSAYVAAAALVWAVADATMDPPHDLEAFDTRPDEGRTWRIAHLSDIHVVGERYGFRIESGRSGPRGNDRLRRVLAQLEILHANEPLHAILITGDMTDAGRSAEWAEFFEAVAQHPGLTELMLMVPGNHDVNIVDRANPARLDLPTSPNKRLRKVRVLSAMTAIQGERARVVDQSGGRLGESLAATLAPHLGRMVAFADAGKPRLIRELSELWSRVFPMVLPPDRDDGLGIILLDSNSDTHFSFTNALGMISAEQARGIDIASRQYPQAFWVIALHHHLVEYPRQAKALSERIGTALINGNWFVRHLQSLAGRVVLMHGHRHVDWIGECAGLVIVSAPSPIMEATNDLSTCFYIHTLAVGKDRRLRLLRPQRVTIAGQPISDG
jgi:3',5'-cyclic AMP phosphodiesterase CpdA